MLFRKFVFLFAAACAILAQDQELPRFAFFSSDYLIQNTAQGKRVFAGAETLGKRLQDALDAKRDELNRINQQLQSSSISEEGRNRLNRELEDGRVAFQRMIEDSREQMQKENDAAFQQLEKEIMPIIEALAKERKLQCVFQFQPGLIAWADQTWLMEFTEELCKRYDAAFPSGTAASRPNDPETLSTPNSLISPMSGMAPAL